MEFSRPYRVLTRSQSVLSRWKKASRHIFATQADVKSKLTINFSSGDSDVASNPKVLVSGLLLNTCTYIFDISYLLFTSLFRTQNGLDFIQSNRTKSLRKKSFDELHSSKSYRKRKEAEKSVCAIPIVLDIFLQFRLITSQN